MELTVIARIHSDFPEKFGVPRQAGICEELTAEIVFEPAYRTPDAVRGLADFSHIWLLWGFSEVEQTGFSATVRPPRLGGNTRMGVFATRSPYRPNPIGLSAVRLLSVEMTEKQGAVLHVAGADLMDGTPIYDIKPYLPYADSHPDASGGFAGPLVSYALSVSCEPVLLDALPQEKRAGLLAALAQDPRPSYQDDEARVYGMSYAGKTVRFTVSGSVLTVQSID